MEKQHFQQQKLQLEDFADNNIYPIVIQRFIDTDFLFGQNVTF